jgi:hypothetical protein
MHMSAGFNIETFLTEILKLFIDTTLFCTFVPSGITYAPLFSPEIRLVGS